MVMRSLRRTQANRLPRSGWRSSPRRPPVEKQTMKTMKGFRNIRYHGAPCADAHPQRRRHRGASRSGDYRRSSDARLDEEAISASFVSIHGAYQLAHRKTHTNSIRPTFLYRTIYHNTKTKVPYTPMSATESTQHPAPADSGAYEAGLTTVGEFDTVESYCRYSTGSGRRPSWSATRAINLFKSGIKPMWEKANANGAKWVLTMKNDPALLDRCWQWHGTRL
jgi:hypothetical protein